MPAPKKVDLLPETLRGWLQETLKEAGFAGYEAIADALNKKLADAGVELRIGKSALHEYGKEFREYTRTHHKAVEEIKAFMTEMELGEEIDLTSAVFQQLVTLQFKLSRSLFASDDALPKPKEMRDLTTALNNLIRSSELRKTVLKTEHTRQKGELDKAVENGALDKETAEKARQLLGFE